MQFVSSLNLSSPLTTPSNKRKASEISNSTPPPPPPSDNQPKITSFFPPIYQMPNVPTAQAAASILTEQGLPPQTFQSPARYTLPRTNSSALQTSPGQKTLTLSSSDRTLTIHLNSIIGQGSENSVYQGFLKKAGEAPVEVAVIPGHLETLISRKHPTAALEAFTVEHSNKTFSTFIRGVTFKDAVTTLNTLDDTVAPYKLKVLFLLEHLVEAAKTLYSLHTTDRAHLDVKPANMIIFGIKNATMIDMDNLPKIGSSDRIWSTTFYASPGHFSKPVSEQSDVYSLAKTLEKLISDITIPSDDSNTYTQSRFIQRIDRLIEISTGRRDLRPSMPFVIAYLNTSIKQLEDNLRLTLPSFEGKKTDLNLAFLAQYPFLPTPPPKFEL